MRLSSIKLAGFKSFVEPTKIPFPDQMTCVVGPNGCGKSNVIDAVRWVLGESSAKNLRGDAMTDVIFNGSTHRKPVSQASVELTFDNQDGRLPGTFAERNQIAIKRVVTRDGQSLYYLNGSKCRRRDITDIFLGTGLGPRSYAIIEQGMISRLIESKPQELRVFIEEAAGVSKYKERRRETQTRIKSTRDNLERLLDVRQELHNQLAKLSEQAKSASEYRTLKAQERTLKGELAVLKWQQLHVKQQEKAAELEKVNSELAFLTLATGGHEDVLGALENKVTIAQDSLQSIREKHHRQQLDLAKAEQQKVYCVEKKRALQSELAKLDLELKETEALLQSQQANVELYQAKVEDAMQECLIQEERFNEANVQIAQCNTRFSEQDKKLAELQQTLHSVSREYQAHQFTIQTNQQHRTSLQERIELLNTKIETHKTNDPSSKLASLKVEHQRLIKQLAQYQQHSQLFSQKRVSLIEGLKVDESLWEASKFSLQTANAKLSALKALLDDEDKLNNQASLLSQLRVKKGYERVVESALLGLDDLLISDRKTPNSVWPSKQSSTLEQLAGSVAALVESGIYPQFLSRIQFVTAENQLSQEERWLMAIDENAKLYGSNFIAEQNRIESRLGQYQALRDLESTMEELVRQEAKHGATVKQATKVLTELENELETVKQSVHELSQSIASNQTHTRVVDEQRVLFEQSTIELEKERDGLLKNLDALEKGADERSIGLEILFARQQALEIELEHHKNNVTEQKILQLNLQRQVAKTQAQLHESELAVQKAQSDLALANAKLTHLASSIVSLEDTRASVTDEQSTNVEPLLELDLEITALLEQIIASEAQLESETIAVKNAKQVLEEKQHSLREVSEQQARLKEKKQALLLEEQSLTLKAQAALEPLDELGQTLKAVLDTLTEGAEAAKHQAALNQIQQKLERLGAVNLAAIDEHQEAKQRAEYLDAQLEDLQQALEMLENAIRKIDRETKSRFKQTFEQVNQDLNELFPKVFGGGSAYLELTSDDMLESGVTIMARPPGKKNSTIHLLSGGEKALTALSLVFSIFRLNPAPFCMLDEVDAPLDDANVGRFCRLVEEMSQSVQFIYISHNKVAMEMAGRLTGVTMAEPGVSRMVAVDIEQAVQMAHA
ncbi:Chromosome partition protein smc [Pseudoalteromonas luteoviolacea B = ATCC 29581]|nr:Chromosome partition protein smc [Pseudoalteromonas luteoviolacea B = ATCC 29581]